MNNDGVAVTTSSEIQPSVQVMNPAKTSKTVRPNRLPPIPGTELTKATPEPSSQSSR